MRATEFIIESLQQTTLAKLYHGNYPDRDETFWDYASPSEFDLPLDIQTLPRHKVMIMLLGQYRAEHIDEITDMLDDEQQEMVQAYVNDLALSSKVIVIAGDRIIDGNHRALAAAIKGVPINYVDLADLENSHDDQQLMKEDEPVRIKLNNNDAAKAWIEKVYAKYPHTMQNNHVMVWGEGDTQQFAMFELVPSMSKKGAVEVKWFQAYPLRQGVGGRAMQELQRLAREDGVGLTLFPWAHGQVSQPKLTKFYKSQGFKPAMKGSKSLSWDHELDEGWKDWVAGAAMGAAALAPQAIDAKPIQPTQKPAIVQPAQQAPQGYNVLSNNSTNEITLQKAARRAGMKGAELAQFMAQMKHESWDFDRMKEKAQPGVKDYYAKRYDMKYSPKTAKILGNKHAGDGARYHGRGFVQLTGRDNYRMASDALGIDLLKNPELASKPEVAAKIAVWYWNTRVKPNVRNFADTASVTKYINPAARGLENRDSNFKDYMRII